MGVEWSGKNERSKRRRGPHRWVDEDDTYYQLNLLLGIVLLAILGAVLVVVWTHG